MIVPLFISLSLSLSLPALSPSLSLSLSLPALSDLPTCVMYMCVCVCVVCMCAVTCVMYKGRRCDDNVIIQLPYYLLHCVLVRVIIIISYLKGLTIVKHQHLCYPPYSLVYDVLHTSTTVATSSVTRILLFRRHQHPIGFLK